MQIPTIVVKREGARGYHIINQCDFDPKRHEIYDGEAKPGKANPEVPVPPADAMDELKAWDDWRDAKGRGVAKLKGIAQAISGRTPEDKNEAVAMIDAEITKRAALAAVPPPPPVEVPPPPLPPAA